MVRVAGAVSAALCGGTKRAAAVAARSRLRVAAAVRKPPVPKRTARYGCGGMLGSPARSAKTRCAMRTRAAVGAPASAVDAETKSLLRRVLRAVHPDKYMANARARDLNSASLQRLNAYVDAMTRGDGARTAMQVLRFLIHDSSGLREVCCTLPPGGSLKPLFKAFALGVRRSLGGAASPLAASPRASPHAQARRASASRDAELLAWLSSHLGEATARRELYESRAAGLAAAKAAIEAEFGMRHLHLGFTAESATAQPLHLAALAEALRCFSAEHAEALSSAHFVLCDPQEVPRTATRPPRVASPDGRFVLSEDGTLWLSLCADWRPLWLFLRGTDLAWAAAAAAAARQRCADADAALPGLAALLRVKYIYAPNTLRPEPLAGFCSELSDAAGVLSASSPAPAGGAYGFGLHVCAEVSPGVWDLAWADATGRALVAYAFGQRSVFVSADCPPWALAHFLAQNGARVDAERELGEQTRAALEGVQASLRTALGVTLGASVQLPDQAALLAAQRLLAAAPELRAAVGQHLSGARLLLVADTDTCRFECLPNGTLCIPVSFRVEDVMRAVLASKQAAGQGAAAAR